MLDVLPFHRDVASPEGRGRLLHVHVGHAAISSAIT